MDNTKMRNITDVLEKLDLDSVNLANIKFGKHTYTYTPKNLNKSHYNYSEFSKKENYGNKYDNVKFYFDYDENTLQIALENKMLVAKLIKYKFKDMWNLNPNNFEIIDCNFNKIVEKDLMNIACWVFNHTPQPKF